MKHITLRQSEQIDFGGLVKLAAVSSLQAGFRTYGSLLQLGRKHSCCGVGLGSFIFVCVLCFLLFYFA